MSLWSNTDANTSVPKFAPSTVNLENTQDNSNLMYANTTADAFITGATIGVFGVSPDETFGIGNVALTIVNSGSGFTVRPTLTITGANTTPATATANVKVVAAIISAAGTGYGVGNTFTASNGVGDPLAILTVDDVDANGNVTAVVITSAGDYDDLPTLVNNDFSSNTGSGSGFRANLSVGISSITITNAGEGYQANSIGVTVSGAGGVDTVVTATVTGQDARNKGAHAGWILRTVGSGGRAGRVNVETLVAMGSMTGDGPDDTVLAP